MLKIVYPICCGMDVHKSFVVASIASTNEHSVLFGQSVSLKSVTATLLSKNAGDTKKQSSPLPECY